MSGVDGGPVQLHLVDSNGMGRMTLSRVVMRRTGNNEYNKQQEPCLQKKHLTLDSSRASFPRRSLCPSRLALHGFSTNRYEAYVGYWSKLEHALLVIASRVRGDTR